MHIEEFFQEPDLERISENESFEEGSWHHAFLLASDRPSLSNKKIALIGIEEPGETVSPSYEIRRHLYKLKRAEYAEEIIDLGNFVFDYKPKSYQTLGFVLSEIINLGIVPIILNGRHDVTYSQYLAFTYLKRFANLVVFDPRIDFNLREEDGITANNYLQKVLMEEPSYLFNFTNIGYQSHFTDEGMLDFLGKLYFDLIRLGEARTSLSDLEPVLRNAHLVSWDLASIRQSDAPGSTEPSPNGFYNEEACGLCRYAGLGNSVRSIGFYEYLPQGDRHGQTAHQVAQMVWYFVDGYLHRYQENPAETKDDFLKFTATMQDNAYQIIFYKSKRTDRWWMEVPINEREYPGSNHIVPCSYNDYLMASKEEIPERWWQAVKKLS